MSQLLPATHADGRTTKFTATIWRNMGKNKNGWKLDSEATSANTGAAKKPVDLDSEMKYKALMDQAKGLLTDGHLELTLAKYNEALAIKSSPYLKGQITKVSALLEHDKEVAQQEEAFKTAVLEADEAFAKEDYVAALELYSSALDIRKDDNVAAKVKECETKIDEEDSDLLG